jgi:hypothetical protein
MNPIKKTFIYFGLGNIFLLILIISYLSYFNIDNDKKDRNYNSNFESVDYAKKMLKHLVAINEIETNYFFKQDYKLDINHLNENINGFKKYLAEEANSITEKGEKETVENLKVKFDEYALIFEVAYKQNNNQQKVYFSDLLPLQNEIIKNLNGIYVANFYAMMSKNSILKRNINLVIISLMIFFELIMFFVLYMVSKSVYKNSSSKEKNGHKREAADYPKYFSSSKS